MKERIEKTKIEKTIYICEVCGKESKHKTRIKTCEKKHTCLHGDISYLAEEDDTCDTTGNYFGIYVKCKDCGEELGEIDFEDFFKSESNVKLIYDFLSKIPSLNKISTVIKGDK